MSHFDAGMKASIAVISASISVLIIFSQLTVPYEVYLVQGQIKQPLNPAYQYNVDLMYGYFENSIYGITVFNVSQSGVVKFASEGVIEVFEIKVVANGQLIGYKAVGWQTGKGLSTEDMMSFSMSLHSFATTIKTGMQAIEVPLQPLNSNLEKFPSSGESIFLSVKRIGWITIDGDSVQSDLNDNITIHQVQLHKFENGYLYNALIPTGQLSQIDLLHPLNFADPPLTSPIPTMSASPSTSPTLSQSPTPSPSIPEFTPVAVLILALAACMFAVAFRKRH